MKTIGGKYLSEHKWSIITRLSVSSLIALGVITLLISILYSSSFLALIGFALVFWCTILLYLAPSKPLLIDLLSSINQSGMSNIEKLLQNLAPNQRGIYLSTNSHLFNQIKDLSLHGKESCILFVSKMRDESSFKLQQNANSKVNITPSGEGLCKLFEQQAGKEFNNMGLQKLGLLLHKILVERLEFVSTFDIKDNGEEIVVELTKSVFDDMCKETDSFPLTHQHVGCLLTSAIACAIAKATEEPIIIEKEEFDLQQRVKRIKYKIVTVAED